MSTGIRESDYACRMLEQRCDAAVVVLVKLGDELRVERQVENIVQGVLAFARRELGDRHAVLLDLRPVAIEQDALLRLPKVLPQPGAEWRLTIDRRPLLRGCRLYAVEGVVRIKEIRLAQREVERERLAIRMDVHLVTTCERLRALLIHLGRTLGLRAVVHREDGDDKRRPPGGGSERLHELRRSARPGCHDEHAAPLFTE